MPVISPLNLFVNGLALSETRGVSKVGMPFQVSNCVLHPSGSTISLCVWLTCILDVHGRNWMHELPLWLYTWVWWMKHNGYTLDVGDMTCWEPC
jgi:hypothetical protein